MTSHQIADRTRLAAVPGLALWAGAALAGIQFEAGARRIWITDFPAAYPATMDLVRAVDAREGWGCVTYDPASDTYAVAASLFLGCDDGTDTYVQLGRPGHTGETWVVDGDVAVHPSAPWPPDAAARRAVNRLTIGAPGAPGIRAALRIASATNAGHSLYVGTFPRDGRMAFWEAYRGQLHVHGGTITAHVEDRPHALGAKAGYDSVHLRGDSVHLRGARIAWVRGAVSGLIGGGRDHEVADTVFEHCGAGIGAYWDNQARRAIRGCVFRECGTGLADPADRVALEDCVFEGNDRNWAVARAARLLLRNCRIAPPRLGDRYQRAGDGDLRRGCSNSVVSLRQVVVETVDTRGQPVSNAVVAIARPREGDRVTALTGPAGRTTPPGSREAFWLTEFEAEPGADPDRPALRRYAYDIEARAAGYADAVRRGYCPTASWDTVRLVLAARPESGRAPANTERRLPPSP